MSPTPWTLQWWPSPASKKPRVRRAVEQRVALAALAGLVFKSGDDLMRTYGISHTVWPVGAIVPWVDKGRTRYYMWGERWTP